MSRLPGPLRLGLQRKIIRASSTTVPSRALAEKLGGPVEVLPMGFDPVQAGSRREGILCFGRLVPIKGFDVALRQLANVSVPIHIVGAGPEEPRLREIVPHARFWGWADDALKREVFEECDRAIFPSRVIGGRHEGWPVSVLEVAHSGIVPFVSPWPGASELVVDGRQVVEDREWRRVGDLDVAELREAVVTHAASYTWDALRKRWLDVVQRAAHQSP